MAEKDRFRDPLDLLKPDESRVPSLLGTLWIPSACAIMGFVGVIFSNTAVRRPIFSGIHRHIIAVTVGAYLGTLAEKYKDNYYAERDAVYRHYIELHREDFPLIERKKYGEILERWAPVR